CAAAGALAAEAARPARILGCEDVFPAGLGSAPAGAAAGSAAGCAARTEARATGDGAGTSAWGCAAVGRAAAATFAAAPVVRRSRGAKTPTPPSSSTPTGTAIQTHRGVERTALMGMTTTGGTT